MKRLLYVDGCICRETSRTERLAQAYLRRLQTIEPCEVSHLILEECALLPLNAERLSHRESSIRANDFSEPAFELARQFRDADELLIAAPYWDMSFPAMLKLYFEQVCINKLTFHYTEKGIPEGLTRIRKATYLFTSGGYVTEATNHGYNYTKSLLQTLFTISTVDLFSAQGLDIRGNDPEAILQASLAQIQSSTH